MHFASRALSIVTLLIFSLGTARCQENPRLVDFAATDPAIFQSGYFETVTFPNSTMGGVRFASAGCQLDFVAHGTSCALHGLAISQNAVQVSVDGNAFVTLTAKALNQWVDFGIYGQKTDTLHHVTVKLVGSPDSFLVNRDRMLTLKGSQPELIPLSQAEPEAWGTQAYPVATAQGPSAYIVPEAKTLQLTKNQDGYPGLLRPDLYSDGSVICRATGSGVRAWMLLNRSDWQVMVDGVNQPIVTLPNQRTYGWVTLASGLDPTKEHTIVITEVANIQLRFGPQALHALMFPDGALTTTSVPPTRKCLMVLGHSIVAGRWLPSMDAVYYQRVAQSQNYAIASRGISGAIFKTYPFANPLCSTLSGQARLTEIVAVQPDICLIDAFVNDSFNGSGAVPRETPDDLQAALLDFLPKALQQCPHTRFYLLGLLDNIYTQNAPYWNRAIKIAVRTQKSSRCQFIDQAGLINTATDTGDGVHPNIQGSQKICNHLLPILFGS